MITLITHRSVSYVKECVLTVSDYHDSEQWLILDKPNGATPWGVFTTTSYSVIFISIYIAFISWTYIRTWKFGTVVRWYRLQFDPI